MIGQRLLARWDVSPQEQASLSFDQVLTLINLRRVEIACLLGIFTRVMELAMGYKPVATPVEIPFMVLFIAGSLMLRRMSSEPLARACAIIIVVGGLLMSQWGLAVLGEQGRLTSGYPMMLLSLTLLFVAPPRFVIAPSLVLLALYCWIVSGTRTSPAEQYIAMLNAALVTVICIVAAALIHAGRRRDYDQQREIRRQNLSLVERNDELDWLMAITAHDLRSPLYGLRNLIDLALRKAPREPALPLTVLDQARTSLDSMLSLATRMLDVYAVQHQSLGVLAEEDVRGHLLAAANRISPLAQAQHISIDLALPDQPLVATLHAGALAQILDNLLANGVRHTPSGQLLALNAMREDRHVVIRVEDRGPGVDPAARDQLFSRLSRIPHGPGEGMPSKGMGLFIVATLAERMGATVCHEPRPHGGATFIIRLPMAL